MDTWKIGYEIDHAYAMADRYLVQSELWHYWMDSAKELEEKARKQFDKI